MALIKSVEMKPEGIFLKLKVSREEYRDIALHNKHVVILPINSDMLEDHLTVGRLGNSNRIMIPKKFMRKYGVAKLPKKAPAVIVNIVDSKYLIVMLEGKHKGIPVFEEGER